MPQTHKQLWKFPSTTGPQLSQSGLLKKSLGKSQTTCIKDGDAGFSGHLRGKSAAEPYRLCKVQPSEWNDSYPSLAALSSGWLLLVLPSSEQSLTVLLLFMRRHRTVATKKCPQLSPGQIKIQQDKLHRRCLSSFAASPTFSLPSRWRNASRSKLCSFEAGTSLLCELWPPL